MPMYEGISLTSDKQTVVIDIGTAYTKFGFTGEFAPRCITKTEVKCPETKQVKKVFDFANQEELHNLLVSFIHNLYFRHLLVSPKDRRVVIVESLLSTTVFRETLAKVLFLHFEVSSLLFIPSHLVALYTLGVKTALVLDVGFEEAVLIPVYDGIPVLHAWQAQPLAAQAIHSSIRALLTASVRGSGDTLANSSLDELSESIVEDIKARLCFVTTLERAQKIGTEAAQPPPPLSVDYRWGGSISFSVHGTVREQAMEVLFQQDNDHVSVATMVLDAIIKCAVDMRKPLSENIVLVGGTAMCVGFKARLKAELQLLITTPKYSSKLPPTTKFKFHKPPGKENYVAWLGGAIFGSTELLQSRSLSKEAYLTSNAVPDWSNLAYNLKEENHCI